MFARYRPKTILNIHKRTDGGWFWTKYSASPYIGCQWGCEYCYLRDQQYSSHRAASSDNLEDPFSQYIRAKENAPELLRKTLAKKERDVIRLGDYQPAETKFGLSRKLLEVCHEFNFPVFLLEKSPALLRDLDLLKQLQHLNVGWSIITTKDDELRKRIERIAPSAKARFEAMKRLSDEGIYTGTVFMPILPFLYDDEENIEAVVVATKDAGGKYVLDGGLSLQGLHKDRFLKILNEHDPKLVPKYETIYSDENLRGELTAQTHERFVRICKKHSMTPYIPRPVAHFPEELQSNRKVAGVLYLRSRELQLLGKDRYREWAYRKAAWAIDDLTEDMGRIFSRGETVSGVGPSILKQIGAHINEARPE